MLRRSLRRRWVVVAAAVAVFAGSLALFRGLGSEYAPEDDSGRLTLMVQAPVGTRVEETAALCQRVLDVALEDSGLSEAELKRLLDPAALTRGGIHGG